MPGGFGYGRARRSHAQPVAAPISASLAEHGRDPLRYTIAAVIFLTISRIHQHYNFLALFRPALLLVGVAAVTAFLRPALLGKTPFLATWPARTVMGIAAIAAFSTVGGISIGGSASFVLENYSKTIILFILIVVTTRGLADLQLYTWALVLGAAFQVYLALFFFQVETAYGSATMRLGDLYLFDANDIGCVLLVALPLSALLAQTSRGVARWACILLMLGIGAAIAKSGSRGAFVGLVATGAVLLISLRGVSMLRRAGVVVVLGLGVTLSTPPGYWEQMSTILEPKDDYNWTSEDGRKAIWSRGMGYMLEYPITGLGPNNFSRAECTIGPKAESHVLGTGIMCAAPHNTYLQAAAEMGIPGGLIWLTMILRGLFLPSRLRKRIPASWEKGHVQQRFLFLAPAHLSIAMFAFAVSTAFVSFAYLDLVYILLALMSGLSIALARAGIPADVAGFAAADPSAAPSAVQRRSPERSSMPEEFSPG